MNIAGNRSKTLRAGFTLLIALLLLTLMGGCAFQTSPAALKPPVQQPAESITLSPAFSASTPMGQAVQALLALESAPVAQRAQQVPHVTQLIQQAGTPLVAANTLIFVYQGKAGQQVQLPIDRTYTLAPVDGTDLFEYQLPFPGVEAGIRAYALVVDGHVVADPWYRGHDPFGQVFRGRQAAPDPPEFQPQPGTPQGKLVRFSIGQQVLGESRDTWVYLPPGYDPAQKYPLLVAFDADFWPEQLPTLFDNLIKAGRIPPLLAVGAPNNRQHRAEEYIPHNARFDLYQRFVHTELLPYVEQHYAVDKAPGRTATLGFSNGGAVAYATVAMQPERYRGGLLFSPFAAIQYQGAAPQGKRFYITQGTLEADVAHGQPLHDLLAPKNQVQLQAAVGGHDMALVRLFLPQALTWLWQGQ